MEFFQELFNYRFLTNAFIASVLSGVVCGIIGTYVVSRRLVFLSGGITHSSFGGIGIAYYMGLNPIMGAMVFAVLSALGIEAASARGRVREDSAIGIVWSVGMALGIIFIYMTPGYAPNLMSFLFGSILAVTSTDIAWLSALASFLVVCALLFIRPVLYIAFDRTFSRSQGLPVKTVSYIMSVLTAMAIVLSIRTVGIVLLISLLTMPPVIVNSLTKSYVRITVWSVVVAISANIAGLWASYVFNVPAGAATIFVLAFTLILVKLFTFVDAKRARG